MYWKLTLRVMFLDPHTEIITTHNTITLINISFFIIFNHNSLHDQPVYTKYGCMGKLIKMGKLFCFFPRFSYRFFRIMICLGIGFFFLHFTFTRYHDVSTNARNVNQYTKRPAKKVIEGGKSKVK